MKKLLIVLGIAFLFILCTVCGCVVGLFSLVNSHYVNSEKDYYLIEENFFEDTGTIMDLGYSEKSKVITIVFDEIDKRYQDVAFEVQGENVDILVANGFLEKASVGKEITYTSAPGYFGDGYAMPIVAISVDGDELLGFKEGYANFIMKYE